MLAPRAERIDRRALLLFLEFIEAIGQIAEAGQDGSPLPVGRAIGIFSERDIPPIVRAVFDGRPMTANERQHRGVIVFLQGQACGVAADLQRGRFFGLVLVLGIALDGNDLPAATQADLLRRDGHPRDASAVKASVFFLPDALRGETPAEPAGVGLDPQCHFGCL